MPYCLIITSDMALFFEATVVKVLGGGKMVSVFCLLKHILFLTFLGIMCFIVSFEFLISDFLFLFLIDYN